MDSPLATGFASLIWGMHHSQSDLDVLQDGRFESWKSGKRKTTHVAIVEEFASRRIESQRFNTPQKQRARPMVVGLTKTFKSPYSKSRYLAKKSSN